MALVNDKDSEDDVNAPACARRAAPLVIRGAMGFRPSTCKKTRGMRTPRLPSEEDGGRSCLLQAELIRTPAHGPRARPLPRPSPPLFFPFFFRVSFPFLRFFFSFSDFFSCQLASFKS